MLHDLCRTHGAARVWLAGLNVLGYPPTWVDGGVEVLALTQALGG